MTVARKTWTCFECLEEIPKGASYHRELRRWRPGYTSAKPQPVCNSCFSQGRNNYGMVVNDPEHFVGRVKVGKHFGKLWTELSDKELGSLYSYWMDHKGGGTHLPGGQQYLEELIAQASKRGFTKEGAFNGKVKFGMHFGEAWEEMSDSFIKYVLNEKRLEKYRKEAEEEYQRRKNPSDELL